VRASRSIVGVSFQRNAATIAQTGTSTPDGGRRGDTEDSQVGLGLSNLAAFLAERGRYAEAEPICRRSLDIREKVLVPDDPKLARTLKRCADILRKLNRGDEASILESRAEAIENKHAIQGSN